MRDDGAMPELNAFGLASNNFGDASMLALAENLAAGRMNVKGAYLRNNAYTDTGVAAVTAALAHYKNEVDLAM